MTKIAIYRVSKDIVGVDLRGIGIGKMERVSSLSLGIKVANRLAQQFPEATCIEISKSILEELSNVI
jgi:hypothetical protein